MPLAIQVRHRTCRQVLREELQPGESIWSHQHMDGVGALELERPLSGDAEDRAVAASVRRSGREQEQRGKLG